MNKSIRAGEYYSAKRVISKITISYAPPPSKKACKKKWAELIKLVYEVDLLQCPKCLHETRIVAIINYRLVVEKILKHLDLWQPQSHRPPVSEETRIVE